MPELPEVETVARSLRERILGRTVSGVWTSGLPLRRPIDAAALRRGAVGARFESVDRRGKYLLLHLAVAGGSRARTGGARSRPLAEGASVILCHLGMSGRLLVLPAARPRELHTHAVFRLDDGAEELRYVDPRRFGFLSLLPASGLGASPELSVLGVDPLSAEFTAPWLARELSTSRRAIKDFLLDQSRIAGVGNIYAAEALFEAGVSPRRRADGLGRARAARLQQAIAAVLAASVARRGTSISDYVDAAGDSGENQDHLAVYGREHQPCRRCQQSIRRLVQGGRSTFYCPRCQR